MPIYEFSCTKCGNQFEIMRPFTQADKPAPCSRCGAASQKLVSLFGSTVDKYSLKIPEKGPFRPSVAAKTSRTARSKTASKVALKKKTTKK
jgi:putative FmdB family regulatory protein